MQQEYPKPPYPKQTQPMPGLTSKMDPRPDHGENSYKGSGKLKGMKAVITGGDSGIGRAVTIAFSREGADVLVAQPAELATAYVMLADPLSSFTSGTTVAVTGGKPFI